jgi:hypothetical protein
MSHRIGHADRHAGNTLAIVDSWHRVVKKDGSLCGARACAASVRAAALGIQPGIPRWFTPGRTDRR